jgi:aspartyl-tRNA(Asn)/glutamyl-tRNA(Gln) amidotransferase subunit C
MPIDAEEVRRIADLARLELPEDEIARLAGDLERIVAHIDGLRGVEIAPGAEALAYFETDVHREDRPGPCLSREEGLANAPETDGAYFLVPRIVDRDEG